MGEIAKLLKDFLSRDLVFIVGGSEIILVLAYVLGYGNKIVGSSAVDLSIWMLIVGAGVAYAIGYVLQDVSCLLRVCSTQANAEPGPFERWLFWRYEHRRWEWESVRARFPVRKTQIDMSGDPRLASFVERTIVLMQLGTTMGPCSVVSGLILLLCMPGSVFGALDCLHCIEWRGSEVVGVGGLILGVALIVLARLKRAQLRRDLHLVSQKLASPGQSDDQVHLKSNEAHILVDSRVPAGTAA